MTLLKAQIHLQNILNWIVSHVLGSHPIDTIYGNTYVELPPVIIDAPPIYVDDMTAIISSLQLPSEDPCIPFHNRHRNHEYWILKRVYHPPSGSSSICRILPYPQTDAMSEPCRSIQSNMSSINSLTSPSSKMLGRPRVSVILV